MVIHYHHQFFLDGESEAQEGCVLDSGQVLHVHLLNPEPGFCFKNIPVKDFLWLRVPSPFNQGKIPLGRFDCNLI